MTKRAPLFTFFAGFEAFHALTHAYLGLSGTHVKGHPAELLGIRVTPTFHGIAAVLHAGIAFALGAAALRKERSLEDRALERPERRRSEARATVASVEG